MPRIACRRCSDWGCAVRWRWRGAGSVLRAMKARRPLAGAAQKGSGRLGRVSGVPVGPLQRTARWPRRTVRRSRRSERTVFFERCVVGGGSGHCRARLLQRPRARKSVLGGGDARYGFDDVERHYLRWFEEQGSRLLLIRPDGYIFGSACDKKGTHLLLASLRDQLYIKNPKLI